MEKILKAHLVISASSYRQDRAPVNFAQEQFNPHNHFAKNVESINSI